MDRISEPVARALVRWYTAEEGGRGSGPPSAAVYLATTTFGGPDHLSLMLQEVGRAEDGRRWCLVGFLVPGLARPHLRCGVELPVLEGPRVVGVAVVEEVFDSL